MSYVMQSKDFACIQLVYGSAGMFVCVFILYKLIDCHMMQGMGRLIISRSS